MRSGSKKMLKVSGKVDSLASFRVSVIIIPTIKIRDHRNTCVSPWPHYQSSG